MNKSVKQNKKKKKIIKEIKKNKRREINKGKIKKKIKG